MGGSCLALFACWAKQILRGVVRMPRDAGTRQSGLRDESLRLAEHLHARPYPAKSPGKQLAMNGDETPGLNELKPFDLGICE